MKKINVLPVCLTVLIAGGEAFATPTTVAVCGPYLLQQDVSSTYFAGIKHTENTYQLINSSGEAFQLSISSNSEGVKFNGLVDTVSNPSTGAIIKANIAEIDAEGNKFELMIADRNNTYKTTLIPCKKK